MKIYKCKYNLSHMYPRENQLLEHEAYCSDNAKLYNICVRRNIPRIRRGAKERREIP